MSIDIIVLSDGEIWEALDDPGLCAEVCTVTDEGFELLEQGYKPKDLEPHHFIARKSVLQ